MNHDAGVLISVLIRTRDRQALLRQAVESVLVQTHRPLEIVVVNDGGVRSDADLIPLCEGAGVRFRWIDNPVQGRSAAANTALEAAAGDWCLFLDDDDWLDPSHLANLRTALQVPGTAAALAAYSDVRTVDASGHINETAFNHPYDALRLRIENYLPIHAVLFARELVARGCRFDESLDRYEDWDFWLQVAQHTVFIHVPHCTASYRINSSSGFGAKEVDGLDRLRLGFYRKWLNRWSDADLLQLFDRSRQFPRLTVLEQRVAQLEAQRSMHQTAQQEAHQQALAQARKHLDEVRLAFTTAEAEWKQMQAAHQAAEQAHQVARAEAQQALAEGQAHIQHLERELATERQVSAALRHDFDVIYQSRSWKITQPLRFLNRVRYIWRVEGTLSVLRRAARKLLRPAPKLPTVAAVVPKVESRAMGPLAFETHDQPRVSIVIPVYNKIEFTFHCLAAVRKNSGDMPYEVIVVDDCSTDDTAQVLARVEGIRVIRNAQNSGFIRSCNHGAAAARGEFLLLLNNDTEPQPGWLDALVQTFDEREDCGMVGAKLLYPDGSLQEAGGIVWRDGSAWNYGRGEDPNKPAYSYLRAVDYCSGAVLLLRSADYQAWGQFDLHYLPAYYEDTDLAFQVRKHGKQVYYQPLSRVIHFEGITNGTDTGGGVKQHQVTNQQKFFARWQEVLKGHRPNGQMPHLERERTVQKRALVVDARALMPDNDSGSLRMFNLLKIIQSLGYKVTFVPDNLQYHERYTPMLQALGIECWYSPYLTGVTEHLQQFGSDYAMVMLSRADVAEKHIDAARQYAPNAQILYDTVDLHFLRERRQAELSGSAAEAQAAELRRLQELGIARKSHCTLVVSPVEVDLFAQEAPDVKVALVSNIHTVHGCGATWQQREDIVFIGSFEHPPNVDAVHHFIDDIYPLVQRQRPGIRLRIVGNQAPRSLTARGNENLVFEGFVPELTPLFNRVRLSIAPLRYGAGVKGKINTSMSYGVPVVASPIAAEGMGLIDGVDALVADTPQAFADAIVRAYDDEALWGRLSSGALANIERHFSFAVATEQMRQILSQR